MDDVQSFDDPTTEAQEESGGAPELDESVHNGLAEAKTKSDDVPEKHKDEEGYARASVPYAFGQTLDEAVENWGEDFVFELAESLFKRKLQNRMRRQLADGIPPERVESNHAPDEYDPTVSQRSSGDDVTDLMKKLNNLSEDEKAEVLESLNV